MATGTESRFQNMGMLVKSLSVNGAPVTGEAPATPDAGDISMTAPGTDATWTDVQTALTDIAARLAVLEAV